MKILKFLVLVLPLLSTLIECSDSRMIEKNGYIQAEYKRNRLIIRNNSLEQVLYCFVKDNPSAEMFVFELLQDSNNDDTTFALLGTYSPSNCNGDDLLFPGVLGFLMVDNKNVAIMKSPGIERYFKKERKKTKLSYPLGRGFEFKEESYIILRFSENGVVNTCLSADEAGIDLEFTPLWAVFLE